MEYYYIWYLSTWSVEQNQIEYHLILASSFEKVKNYTNNVYRNTMWTYHYCVDDYGFVSPKTVIII